MLVGLLALAGLLLLPPIRDLPRRIVEARLSDVLDAEVAVGSLRLGDYPRVVLESVVVRRAETLPLLRVASFPEVWAQVRLRGLLAGRIDRLLIPGGGVELDARCDLALRLPETAAALEIGELSVARLDVGLHYAEQRTIVSSEVDLRGGTDPDEWTGSWGLRADEADLDAVLVLLAGENAPACRQDVEHRLAARGLLAQGEISTLADPAVARGAADHSARRAAFHGTLQLDDLTVEVAERSLVIDGPSGELDWQVAAPRRLEATFELGPLGRGRFIAELDGAGSRFQTFEGELSGLDFGVLLPLAVAEVASAEGGGELHLHLGEHGIGTWEGKGELSTLLLRAAAGEADLRSIELGTSGRLDLDGNEAVLTMTGVVGSTSLKTADGWTVEAEAVHARGEGTVVLADVVPRIRLGEVTAELGARLEPWGEIEATATLEPGAPRAPHAPIAELRGTWLWHGIELAALQDRLAAGEAGRWMRSWTIDGRVDGRGTFSGRLTEPSLGGRLEVHGLRLEAEDDLASYQAETASLELRRSATGAIEIEGSSRGEVTLGRLAAVPLQLELGGTGTAGALTLDQGAATLGADGALGVFTATGSGRLDSAWQGKLRLDEADVGAWYALLFPDSKNRLAAGGRLALDLDWRLDGGRWSGGGRVELDEGTLASADGSRVLAPLDWSWNVDADGDTQRISAHLTGEIGGFQTLWDAVFADYTDTLLPLVIDLEGSRDGDAEAGRRLTGEATIDLGPGAVAKGQLSRTSEGQMEYGLQVRAMDLGPVVERLVRRPFAGGSETLAGLTGRGALQLEAAGALGEGGGETRGALRATALDLALGDEIAVAGLDLDLPLDLAWSVSAGGGNGGSLELHGPVRSGTLRFASLEARGVVLPTTTARLEVEGETIRLVDRLSVPVLGGSALLDSLRLSAGLTGEDDAPRLETAVELDGLDLARITETFDLFPLEGWVDGVFPGVVVSAGELRTRGSGELTVFGGQATVEQVAVTELFSRFPRVTLGARFENLDLGQITRTLEFGEITGRIHGELRAVELVGGAPVRFLGRIESVPVTGVKQRVSLKAANNLALLGTGTSGALGGGLLPRLFDRFPYVGLGIELALARDRFQLRGLLRRGDRELFLKGRLPLRLDIVNVRPGATVSFKTMMSRLGNLEIGRPEEHRDSNEQQGGE